MIFQKIRNSISAVVLSVLCVYGSYFPKLWPFLMIGRGTRRFHLFDEISLLQRFQKFQY